MKFIIIVLTLGLSSFSIAAETCYSHKQAQDLGITQVYIGFDVSYVADKVCISDDCISLDKAKELAQNDSEVKDKEIISDLEYWSYGTYTVSDDEFHTLEVTCTGKVKYFEDNRIHMNLNIAY